MPRGKTNPFTELTLDALWMASQQRAGELLAPGVARTPEQRAQLAESTALLLLAMGKRINPAAFDGRLPERVFAPDAPNLADAFADDAQRQIREVRYHALQRAADFVLGARGWHWMRNAQIDGREVAAVATDNDAGLRRALELLQAERDARG